MQIFEMGRCVSIFGAIAVLPLALLATSESALAATSETPSSWIVTCDCGSPAKRERIEAQVQKLGGKILYRYENIGGFSVAPRKRAYSNRLARALRRVPGIFYVRPSGVSQLYTAS